MTDSPNVNRHQVIRDRLEALSKWVRGATPEKDVTMFVDTAEIELKAQNVIHRIDALVALPLEEETREELARQVIDLQIQIHDLKYFCECASAPLERLHSAFFADDEDENGA